jgi:SPP1 gp7 family putative phage head morphogenesis protein
VSRAQAIRSVCICGCGAPSLQAEVRPFAVNPREAIEFMRRKVNVPSARWTDLWQQEHSVGFTVAGALNDDLLADFRQAVDKAIADGTTLETFRRDFDRIVDEHGWSYNGSRNWRSRVIFETNMSTAYAAGRWEQVQRVKRSRPYLRYVHVDPDATQKNTRREHASWHDTVLPVDDPWWQTHYPPNGWGCRCTVQSLNERDLDRYGLSVSDEAPPVRMVERTVRTSEGLRTIEVPEGIDPGFAYRAGALPGAFAVE